MIPNPYILLGAGVAAVALAAGSYYYGGKHEAQEWELKLSAQKLEAAQTLADEKKKNADREEADRQRAITNQADYDTSLKALVDSNRKYAGQLRFATERSRVCGGSPPTETGPRTGTTENAALVGGISGEAGTTVSVALPDALTMELRKFADDADKLATWAKSCFLFVNK